MCECTRKEAPNKGWKPLSAEEREVIAIWRTHEDEPSALARRLGRDKGIISRELHRNGSPVYGRYNGVQAQKRAEARLRDSHVRERIPDGRVREH
jgi:IS30 family transposase